jgi:hypothetical protein
VSPTNFDHFHILHADYYQVEVSFRLIQEKVGQPGLNAQFSSISRDESAAQVDNERSRQDMYTSADEYKHMEVQILHKDAKLLTGMVLGSHLNNNGSLVVDVRTSTHPMTSILHLLEHEVVELWQVLPT